MSEDRRTLVEQLAEARSKIETLWPEEPSFQLFCKQTADGVPYDAFRPQWPFEREA